MKIKNNNQKSNNKLKKSLLSVICHLLSAGNGFSLIELLVVVTLIGIIGAITTQVFILGIRTQVKSEILKEVKQNGDYTISVLEAMIRNSVDAISVCNTDSSQLTIQNQDGNITTFDCSSDHLASISGSDLIPSPTGQPLTNSKVVVSSCTFRVVCPTPALSPKYVYINFIVSQAGIGASIPESASLPYQTTVSLRKYK